MCNRKRPLFPRYLNNTDLQICSVLIVFNLLQVFESLEISKLLYIIDISSTLKILNDQYKSKLKC